MAKISQRNSGPIDWNLPNAELARIWGVHEATIRRRRKLACNPAPRWTLRGGGQARDGDAYQKAVVAEEVLAAVDAQNRVRGVSGV